MKEFNIVLDIDATLVCTNEDESHSKVSKLKIYTKPEHSKYRNRLYTITVLDINVPPGTGEITKMQGMNRPHLEEFIDFCFKYFNKVIIWSAGTKRYVKEMCKVIFKGHQQPHHILTRDDCVIEESLENGEIVYGSILKSLDKIFQNPRFKGIVTSKNTFVVDDREDTFSMNPENGILIPNFDCDINIKEVNNMEDNNLLKLMFWFITNEVSSSKDIRELKKDSKTIFGESIENYIKKIKKEKLPKNNNL